MAQTHANLPHNSPKSILAIKADEVVPKSVEKLGVWPHTLVAPTRLRVTWS